MTLGDTHYDRTPAYQTTHDPAADSDISTAIVAAVSHVAEHDPADLPPFQQTIDADALNSLFTRTGFGVTVSFSYAGYGVTVADDGTIQVFD